MSSVAPDQRKPDPLIGRTVNDRFTVLSVIARGGMGKVYRAEQAPLGRICALKVLNPKYQGDEDPEFKRRFYLEASTAAKLTHPNTVTIFDYGRDERQDIYYIAMEYVRGRTLFRILREEGPMSEDRVAHVMRQVGRSLREAHSMGVIHRDMKPANVVLVEGSDEKDGVKVLDFGLVKDVTGDDPEDLTQQGLFMGSPKYMAPEQILGNTVSAATDIYSLGVVAYELLTGEVPFDKGASVKTLMAHVNELPRPMQRVNPNVYLSAEMTSIVMRCLEKEPRTRFQSMDELLRALTKVEGGGTLTDSLLAGPVVTPPSVSTDDVYAMLPDAEESQPTRPIQRESVQPPMPDSIHPGSLHPSATPEPMEQLTFDDLDMQPKSSMPIRVAIGVVAVVGLAAIAFAVTDGDDRAADQTTVSANTSEPAASTPSTAATPEVRTVKITSEPSGAKVMEGDTVHCGATPCKVTWRDAAAKLDQHELVLSLDDHDPVKIQVSRDQNEIAGKLERSKPKSISHGGPQPRATPRAPQPKAAPKADPKPKPKPKTLSGYKDSPY